MGRLSLRRLAGPRPAGRSTQATHVAVEAIEDGVVRLAGSPGPEHRAVLEVDGTAALPEIPREQEAVLAAYAAFLNGLAFPVQVLVRVLPYDFDAYVSRLARRTTAVCGADEGLASLAADHVAFLRRLARSQTLLERRCYVVVPADSGGKTAAPASDAGSAARVADGRGQGPQPELPESGRGWPWIRAFRPRFGAPRTVPRRHRRERRGGRPPVAGRPV